MQKIGFSLQTSYARPMPDVLRLLRDIGFHAVSPVWQKNSDLDVIAETAAQCGLTLQSLHGPLRGLANMWNRDSACSGPLLQDFLDAADACADYNIPLLVVHSWSGLDYSFRAEDLYFGNFDHLVNYAQQKGILIAFENLEGPEYLAALMSRYSGCPAVGFCWDSGHERCYTPTWDFLTPYGDRLLMTHLNDNFGITDPYGRLQGTDDLHLIPGDGISNWTEIMANLKQARRQEILNFELKIRPKGDRCKTDLYSKLPLDQYLTNAYEAACRISAEYFE